MKYFLGIVFFLAYSLRLFAQQDQTLPIDENGKFIYYEVVETSQVSKDSLKMRLLYFIKEKNNNLKYKSATGDTSFIATGKLIISKTILVTGHPSGEILFNFQVEIRSGKYRYWLTDFIFIPYHRDRYGNFVASTTVGIPLEKNPGKLNMGQWKEYQIQAATYAKKLGTEFKAAMIEKSELAAKKVPNIVKKEWR